MKTWREIQAEYGAEGKHHHLKLTCVICGNTLTCRCRTPKDEHEGVCPECEGKAMKQATQNNSGGYSDLTVMHSGAGYYIGRSYRDEELGYDEPGSRESDYYSSKSEAQKDLDNGSFAVRDCSENNSAYGRGDLPDIRKETVKKEEVLKAKKSAKTAETLARYMEAGQGRSGQGHVTSDGNTVKVTYGKYNAEFNLKTKAAYLDIDGSQIVAIKPLGGFEMKPGRKTGVTFKFDDGGLNEGLVEIMNVSPDQLLQKFEGDSQVSFFVTEARNKTAFDHIAANLMSVFEDIRKDLDEARSKTTDPKALKDLDAVAKGLALIERGVTTQGQKAWEPKRVAVADHIRYLAREALHF